MFSTMTSALAQAATPVAVAVYGMTTTATAESPTQTRLSLAGTDAGGAQLSFNLLTLPENGTLLSDANPQEELVVGPVEGASIIYKPDTGFAGQDVFEFQATNVEGASASATGRVIVADDFRIRASTIGDDLDGTTAGERFGAALDMSADGTVLAIGAPLSDAGGGDSGEVLIYQLTNNEWSLQGSPITGTEAGEQAGRSLALSGDGLTLVVGAERNTAAGQDTGQVRVYRWGEGAWNLLGLPLSGAASSDYFGKSVAVSHDGSTIAIGAVLNDTSGLNAGQVRVYSWDGSAWLQIGDALNGERADDRFGFAIALSENARVLAVGAPQYDADGQNAGQAKVYSWDGAAWQLRGLPITGTSSSDRLGSAIDLSVDGGVVAIGSPGSDGNGQDAGRVSVFSWNGSDWEQKGFLLNGQADGDGAGSSLALSASGDVIAIGAPYNSGNGALAGHVRLYRWDNGSWIQLGSDIDGEKWGDESGAAVALSASGQHFAVGARFNDGDTANSTDNRGHVRALRTTNTRPSVSGARAFALTGSNYRLVPQASDPDGDTLTFGVVNQPAWSQFNVATGELSGVPALGDVGSYADVAITVSDGEIESSTLPFTVTVLLDTDADGDPDSCDSGCLTAGFSADSDDDDDGFIDTNDDFPTDPDEWLDQDDDGIGSNSDRDDTDPTVGFTFSAAVAQIVDSNLRECISQYSASAPEDAISITCHSPVYELGGLELFGLRNLHLWDFRGGDLTSLASKTQLEQLSFGQCCVDSASYATLDLSPLTTTSNLTHLYIERRDISSLAPLQNLASLESLLVYYGTIPDVAPGAFAGLTGLTTLSLRSSYNNSSILEFDWAALADVPALEYLELRRTAMSGSAELSALAELTTVRLYENWGPLASLETLSSVQYLTVDRACCADGYQPFEWGRIGGMTGLRELSVQNATLNGTVDLALLSFLTTVQLSGVSGDLSPVNTGPSIETLTIYACCSYPEPTLDSMNKLVNLVELELSNVDIPSGLDTPSGRLEHLDLYGLGQSNSSSISYDTLLASLINPAALRYLSLRESSYGGSASSVAVDALSPFVNLTHLYLYSVTLDGSADLSGLESLYEVTINYSDGTALPSLATLPALQYLQISSICCGANPVRVDLAPLQAHPTLNRIYLGNVEIEHIEELTTIQNLSSLDLHGVIGVADLDFVHDLSNVTDLRLTAMPAGLDFRPVTGLTNLTQLVLASNDLRDIGFLSAWQPINSVYLGLEGNPFAVIGDAFGGISHGQIALWYQPALLCSERERYLATKPPNVSFNHYGGCQGDSDGDLVGDSYDAFPNDPAASIDTDGDRRPDEWNEGATPTQIASSTLTIDQDDDNDGVDDRFDGFPLISITGFPDADKDGQPDICNTYCLQLGMTADSCVDEIAGRCEAAYFSDIIGWSGQSPVMYVKAGRELTSLRALEFKIGFDPELLMIDSPSRVTGPAGAAVSASEISPGQWGVALALPDPMTVSVDEVLATVQFTVLASSAPTQESPISITDFYVDTAPVNSAGGVSFFYSASEAIAGTVTYWADTQRVVEAQIQQGLVGGDTLPVVSTDNGVFSAFAPQGSLVSATVDYPVESGITAYDASLVLQSISNGSSWVWGSPIQRALADADGNGLVQALDASRILEYTLGSVELPFSQQIPIWRATTAEGELGYDLADPAIDPLELDFLAGMVGDISGTGGSVFGARVEGQAANSSLWVESAPASEPYTFDIRILASANFDVFSTTLVLAVENVEFLEGPAGPEGWMWLTDLRSGEVMASGASGAAVNGEPILLASAKIRLVATSGELFIRQAALNETTVEDLGTAVVLEAMADTDGDGVADINDQCPDTMTDETLDEVGCTASQRDSDGDGLSDADEIALYGTDPFSADSDGDGWSDGEEIESETDPLSSDSEPNLGGLPVWLLIKALESSPPETVPGALR